MKKIVRTFLTIGKALSIVFFVCFVLSAIIFLIIGIVGLVSPDVFAEVDYEGELAIGIIFTFCGVLYAFVSLFAIPTFIFTGKLKERMETAKESKDIRGAAIGCIVAGAMCIAFTLVAGILALVFADKIIDSPVVDNQ